MNDFPPLLPTPYAGAPEPQGPVDTPELKQLVNSQVEALVAAAPSSSELSATERDALTQRISRVATYAAALALDDWRLSEKLGQRPLIKTKETLHPPEQAHGGVLAQSMTQADFSPQASSQVASVTRSTLRAISFPSFVADLIKGTFNAILDATQTQMGAFTEMLEAVSQTVEQFESENVSDLQAQQWLAQSYPQHIRMEAGSGGPQAVATEAEEPPAGLRSALNLPDEIDVVDQSAIDEVLVPAARRKMAQSRLQMLSAMVMMGLQRIVINHGRIRATMGFHIDASDSAHREQADLLDASVAAQGKVGFGMWSASASTSVTYVRSTKADSNAELNVNADLTGEVDLTFSTDYLPLNRMATTERIAAIRANTPNPAENAPAAVTGVRGESSDSPSASQMIASRLEGRERLAAPDLPDLDPNRFGNESGSSANQPGRQSAPNPRPGANPAPGGANEGSSPSPEGNAGEGAHPPPATGANPSATAGANA